MVEIQSVIVPVLGTAKYINILAEQFPISPTNGINIKWELWSQGTKDFQPYPSEILMESILTMPQNVYDLWGTNDSYIIDWVLDQLGFIAVN
jgi:hypothetical protein